MFAIGDNRETFGGFSGLIEMVNCLLFQKFRFYGFPYELRVNQFPARFLCEGIGKGLSQRVENF